MTGAQTAGTAGIVSEQAATGERLLIALDVDGTVLLEDESLSPGIVDAVAHARAAGHEITLATGRSWARTHGVLRVLGLDPAYVVCSNGAVTMKRVGGDEVAAEHRYERDHVEVFDATEVLQLLRENLPDGRYLVELADGTQLCTQDLHDWDLADARRVPFEELSASPACRVVVVSPEGTSFDFLDLASRIGLSEVSYSVGWSAWLDIAPEGVDKSTALERVRRLVGVDPRDVIAAGDGRNDLGMLRWAGSGGGRAIAMGQGPEEVRREATETIATVYVGGISDVLRAL